MRVVQYGSPKSAKYFWHKGPVVGSNLDYLFGGRAAGTRRIVSLGVARASLSWRPGTDVGGKRKDGAA